YSSRIDQYTSAGNNNPFLSGSKGDAYAPSYSDIPGAAGGAGASTRDPAMQFLYDLEVIGSTEPAGNSSSRRIDDYKIIVGDYNSRIGRLRTAMQTIMQSGVQVSLVQ